MSGLLRPAPVSPTVVGVGVVRTSSAKITIIRASRWSQTLDRHALVSGEPPWGIEPQTYALRVASVSSIKCLPHVAGAEDV
jgi:hypothetical protein